jgi:hypothetical protein
MRKIFAASPLSYLGLPEAHTKRVQIREYVMHTATTKSLLATIIKEESKYRFRAAPMLLNFDDILLGSGAV